MEPSAAHFFVAGIELVSATLAFDQTCCCCAIELRDSDGATTKLIGDGASATEAIQSALQSIVTTPFHLTHEVNQRSDGLQQWNSIVTAVSKSGERCGVGKFVSSDAAVGQVVATLRALNHAAILKAPFRANNQKHLRSHAKQTLDELIEALGLGNLSSRHVSEAEGILLEQLNQVASSAVLTATNYPDRQAALSLFDTSAWLYDKTGNRRDSFMDTDLWLAWYPGLQNDHLTVAAVVDSMPAATANEIPWIVKLLENPESRIRFRGAVHLDDHDILHVLLGRGLQDQDEAFVIGFAMGTAKKSSYLQKAILRWFISRLYPEPYRIPAFLLPAFELGVQCGRETGVKDLYKRRLNDFRGHTMSDARREFGIDVDVLKKYFALERDAIPMTIASIRLPV
jgi:hypothetical protein